MNPRFDVFLIWGNGLQHARAIINDINEHPDFKLLRIRKHKIEGAMDKFVEKVYKCDDAPWGHLMAKTRYLLKSPAEVVYLLIWNKEPRVFIKSKHGDNEHRESKTIVDWKTKIRKKYNPSPEEHVVHVTDNSKQAEYLRDIFDKDSRDYYICYPIAWLKANILGKGASISLRETPHYKFVTGDEKEYIKYYDAHWGKSLKDNHTPEMFRKMINMPEIHPIRVSNGNVLDGVHRAAMALSRGCETIPTYYTGVLDVP